MIHLAQDVSESHIREVDSHPQDETGHPKKQQKKEEDGVGNRSFLGTKVYPIKE